MELRFGRVIRELVAINDPTASIVLETGHPSSRIAAIVTLSVFPYRKTVPVYGRSVDINLAIVRAVCSIECFVG